MPKKIRLRLDKLETDPVRWKIYHPTFVPEKDTYIEFELPSHMMNTEKDCIMLSLEGMMAICHESRERNRRLWQVARRTEERMNTCLLFHDWSKWEQYEEEGVRTYIGCIYPKDVRGKPFNVVVQRQKRICRRCGKVQDEEIE